MSLGKIAAPLRDVLHRNVEYLLAEVSGLEPAGHRVLAMRPFGERMEVVYMRIAIGQLILRLVPPAAGSAFGPRAMMALVAHSMVWRSTPGVRFPDAPSAATGERSDRKRP